MKRDVEEFYGERMKLGELVNIKTGKLDANAAVENGQYPFFTTAREISRIDKYSFDDEVVLVAGNGDLNVKYYKGKFDAYQRTYVLTCKKDKELNMKYLYYFMEKYLGVLRQQAIGCVIKYIKLENLTEPNIYYPSIETQTQIAQILDKSTALIAKRKAQIAELDKLVQSVFLEMFGDPITNPKKWEMGKFADICELNPKSEKYDDNLDVSFIPMQLVSENSHKVSFEIKKYKQVKKGFTPFIEGDVLFAKITPCMENGKAGIAQQLKNNIGFGSTEFHVFRPKYVEYSSFIYSLVHLPLFRELCSKHFSGSAGHKRVPKDFLENFNLYLPIFEQIQHFEKIFEKIHAQKSLLQKSLAELEVQHQALMQKAFNGQLVG